MALCSAGHDTRSSVEQAGRDVDVSPGCAPVRNLVYILPRMSGAEATDRVLAGGVGGDDGRFDRIFRPTALDEFVGQSKHKENLKVFIEAARRRGEPLDHLLLSGPPGLG